MGVLRGRGEWITAFRGQNLMDQTSSVPSRRGETTLRQRLYNLQVPDGCQSTCLSGTSSKDSVLSDRTKRAWGAGLLCAWKAGLGTSSSEGVCLGESPCYSIWLLGRLGSSGEQVACPQLGEENRTLKASLAAALLSELCHCLLI